MKKIFLFLTIIFSIIYLYIQAQNFSLTAPGNLPVNYGDTITIFGTLAAYPVGVVNIKNNATVTKPVMVLRQELSMVPGTESAFAFGWNMYAPPVSLSPYSFDLLPGVTDSSFQGWYFHNGFAGTSYVQYNFFDEFNTSDSAWVVFKYVIPQATSLVEYADEIIIVSPNPVLNKFRVSNTTGPARILLYDAIGKFHCAYKFETKTREIDISNLKSGIYFIFIENENGEKIHFSKLIKE